MFEIRVELSGLEEAFAQLERVKVNVAGSILRQALRYGSTPILSAARQYAPVRTGLLKKSLGVKITARPSAGTAVAIIGPRKGMKQPIHFTGRKATRGKRRPKKATRSIMADPVKYAHLMEGGTRFIKPRRFLGSAWVGARQEAKQRIADKIAELVVKRTA